MAICFPSALCYGVTTDSPSSTLHQYNWEVPFDITPPFDTSGGGGLLAAARSLISDLLRQNVSLRKGIWNVHKVLYPAPCVVMFAENEFNVLLCR